MYFITKRGRLYHWALQQHPLNRYALLVTIIALLFSAWWFYVWLPMRSKIEVSQHQIKALKVQLIEYAQDMQDQPTREKEVTFLQSKIQKLTEQQQDTALELVTLEHAQQAGLVLESYTAGKVIEKNEFKKRYDSLRLRGTQAQVVSFFNALAQSSNAIQCTEFSLQRVGGQECTMACTIQTAIV